MPPRCRWPRSCFNSNCVAGADSLANLVDNNANDKVSGIQSQCAHNMPAFVTTAAGRLRTIPSTGAWADCAPLPPAMAAMIRLPYVEVRTRTQTANGAGRDNFLKNWVAGMNGNSTTSSAGACARAVVGNPRRRQQRAADHLLGLRLVARHRRHHRRRRGSYYPSPVYNGAPNDNGYGGAGQPPWPTAAATPPAQIQGQEIILLTQNPPGGCHPAHWLPRLERAPSAGWLRRPWRSMSIRASSWSTRTTG